MSAPITVLLYYKYVRVSDPQKLAAEQRALCQSLGLRGRILIGAEGINGTVAGVQTATDAYQENLRTYPEFGDVVFKVSSAEKIPFPRLEIKVRREIVTLGAGEELDPTRDTAPHLSPLEWKRMIEEDDVVLFDVRNRYESEVGRFKGAITPPIENFRELPAILPQYESLKDKTVLMYCTGGIRCEKASALFREAGFKKVFQLEGGIVTYGEQVGDAHWEGDCFVFDERMMVPVGSSAEKEPVGRCEHTGRPTRNVVNCLHDPCHKILLVAPEAIAANPDFRLCAECLGRGLTSATADYVGSPARKMAHESH
ncbi:MAG TPA: rhodanese-related sulfurtransferase [Opitutaceae bacterium]|nr:rhodanese-related sulfurtransferase [Opitutaceae bacterium]